MSVKLPVKVIPKATRNEIAGWLGDALKVRVMAPPERGKANAAVLETIAAALGISRQDLRLLSGGTAERKVVEVQGLTEPELRARVQNQVADKDKR